MQTKTVTLSYAIEMTFDPKSEVFKNALQEYGETYGNDDPKPDDMLQHIAYNLMRGGAGRCIEGVGYVMLNGTCADPESFCGVTVDCDDPDPDIEVED
ncbi:MAG: hypothetical protein JNM22_05580 [Saprospiraceae bacterium]|nr:hypothetical protein [Saprospiraceae bacterium]